MPTVREVARLAGVSTSTVSHFLNKSKAVSSELQARILDAMQTLGYRQADTVARSLRSGQTGSIGVILDEIAGARHNRLLKGIAGSLNKVGLTLMLRSSGGDWSREAEHIEDLIGYQVDAAIIGSTGVYHDGYDRLARYRIPVVVAGNVPAEILESQSGNVGLVSHCVLEGARDAARHMAEMGHRRLAMVGAEGGGFLDRQMIEGFCEGVAEAGIDAQPGDLALAAPGTEGARHALFQLLRRPAPPTGIFVADPRLLTGVLNGVFNSGLRCPEEISLVAFGDLDWAEAVDPPLTVVAADDYALGEQAVRMLLGIMNGSTSEIRAWLPTHLVPRGSVARLLPNGARHGLTM